MSMSIKAAVSESQGRRQASAAPVLTLSSGTLEALKWLALLLMTFDHVNKHLLHASVPELFAAGRLAMPLFGFVLGYNLARPDALAVGAFKRTAARLAVFGSIASVPFIALGGLGWGWWPFNVMATLLVATLCAWLMEVGGWVRIALACAAAAGVPMFAGSVAGQRLTLAQQAGFGREDFSALGKVTRRLAGDPSV